MSSIQNSENDKTYFVKEYRTSIRKPEEKNGIEEKTKI
jgi:hypothetical protein